MTLWHATTTAVVPPSPEPFELLPPAVHGGQAVWPPAVAPPEFIYLGDAIVLAFIPEAAAKHGGLPVLLDVEVALADLAPDPAYIETAHWLRTVGRDEFGLDALRSLRWSGRVATPGPVRVVRRRVCHRGTSLAHGIRTAFLGELRARWYDDTLVEEAARSHRASFNSAQELRQRVGDRFVPQIFEDY